MEKESHQGLGLKKQKGLRAEMTEGMMDNLSPKTHPRKSSSGVNGVWGRDGGMFGRG